MKLTNTIATEIRKGLANLLDECPYIEKCSSKPKELPNCIEEYKRCMIYKFYIKYGEEADYIGI